MIKKALLIVICLVLFVAAWPYLNVVLFRFGPEHYPPSSVAVLDNGEAVADIVNGTVSCVTKRVSTNSVPWTDITITENTNKVSDPIDLTNVLGYFSIHLSAGNATRHGKYKGSGNGTLTVDYLVSNDGTNFVDPSGLNNDIVTGFTYNSGDGSNGEDVCSFSPPCAKYLKIRATNTEATSGNITLTATLSIF